MKSRSNTQFILVGLLAFGAVFFLFRQKAIKKPAELGETASQPTKVEIKDQYQPEEKKPLEQIRLEKKRYAAMVRSGLRTIPTTVRQDGLSMKVRVKAEQSDCSLGDFDFLKGAVDRLNDDNFLFSIESLENKKFKTHRRLSLAQIADGDGFDVILPRSEGNQDFGLSVCFDFKKSNECESKPLLAGNEWKTLLNKIKSNDRTFYYQVISVKGTDAFLIPSFQWDTSTVQRLKSDLKSVVKSPDSIDKLKNAMQKLRSLPARVVKDALVFPLAARHSKCQ